MKVINFEKENQIQPLFLGESLGVQKYLSPQHPKLEALTVRQMEYFWRPERHAANIAQDNLDYPNLTESERHVFLSNIQYQIVLDTIQGRAIIPALMPFVSCDELESCITAWQFFENIHSRSYSFILKNVLPQPEDVFDGIDKVQEIIERSNDICNQYEELITYAIQYSERTSYSEKIPLDKDELDTLKTSIYLTLISINILEGVRFYTSFACSFALAENNKMLGTGKILSEISRDEAQHLNITQYLVNTLNSDKDWQHITQSPQVRSQVEDMYRSAVQQEEDWAKYLFSKGCLLGLNEAILSEFIKWICNTRTKAIGYGELYPESKSNPITWILRHLGGAETQSALQETVTNTYLEGGGLDLTKPLDFSSKKRKFSL
ncbi:ribonucleotide reductase subunit B [Pseudanabaena phage Pam2]|nr:ribonucleotide reductase subunit B [Pseudanabaena phage Pam2]